MLLRNITLRWHFKSGVRGGLTEKGTFEGRHEGGGWGGESEAFQLEEQQVQRP